MIVRGFTLSFIFITAVIVTAAQRVAVFEPDDSDAVKGSADAIRNELATKIRVLDHEMAMAAFRSVEIADHYNMTAEDARQIGRVVGCDAFVLLKTRIQRRASADKPEHFEAFAAVYIVDSRTGSLIDWQMNSFEGRSADAAASALKSSAGAIASAIAGQLKNAVQPTALPRFPEPPPESSPQFAGLKLPIPYKRIRPEYTSTAFLYGIKVTVDIEADIDTDGSVKAMRILRWAGYGLDQSVEKAVRSMNWRPAMRDGKPLPMRVLLRYNFTKIERDEEH